MQFKRTRNVGQGEAILDALYDDINSQLAKLPLQRFCIRGGWPLNEKISNIVLLENTRERLVASLFISFTESGAACCSGDNFEHEHFEELRVVVRKDDWAGQFPTGDDTAGETY